MNENHCALTLAILSPVFLTPEQSFECLTSGIVKRKKGQRNTSGLKTEDTADMIQMRLEGMTYRQIAECYGIDQHAVHSRIKRFKGDVNEKH